MVLNFDSVVTYKILIVMKIVLKGDSKKFIEENIFSVKLFITMKS